MPKDISPSDFAQEQLLYSIIKEGNVSPGSWRTSPLPEPEAQGIGLHSSTQPED